MKRLELSLPELGFIISTRAALGAGLGLLAGAALSRRERRLVGLALLGIGAVTTVPAVLAIRRSFTVPETRDTKPPRTAGASA